MTLSEKLYPFQTTAVEFCLEREGAAIFCEQGTGKTYISASLVERLIHPTFMALLIVPLANIETSWVKTLNLIKKNHICICRTYEEFNKDKGYARVLLIHYEAVRPIIKKIRKLPWDLIIYDESQRLKARGSKQSRDAARFVYGHRRVVLSGTPIDSSPMDMWAQFRFAVPSLFGERFKDFKEEYLKETGYMGYKLAFRPEKMEQFRQLIAPYVHRVLKSEVLDLPPLEYKRVGVDLFGEQARVYRELEEDMCVEIGPHTVTCDMAITQVIRLQQVTGGFVRADPTEAQMWEALEQQRLRRSKNIRVKSTIVALGRAKLRKLRTILSHVEHPVVVFCKYTAECLSIAGMCEEMGLRVGVIRGKTKKHRTGIVEAFQAGEYDTLICQIKAGGVGLDLQRAHVGVMYSPTFSFIDFDQAVCRLHRNGQSKRVTIFLLFAKNTVDEEIYAALLSKRKVTRTVLRRRIMAKTTTKTAAPAKKEAAAPAKKAPEAKAEEKPAKPEAPTFKYGVKDLATALDIKEASVRVRLRSAKVPKAGKSYGWNSKAELEEVIKSIKSEKKAKAADEEGDEDADEGEEEETEEEEEDE